MAQPRVRKRSWGGNPLEGKGYEIPFKPSKFRTNLPVGAEAGREGK